MIPAHRVGADVGDASGLPAAGEELQPRCRRPYVADGCSLSCAVIAAGTAVRWDRYWRQYRIGECR